MTNEKLPRAYAPDLAAEGTPVTLGADESAHLSRTLRLRPGARVVVFDGRGREFLAELTAIGRRHVTVMPVASRQPAPEPSVRVTIGQALLKGHKMDDVVRDGVMLGVAAIQPLITEHTEALRSPLDSTRRVARWQRIAAASAGQCGRAVVPEVRPTMTLVDFLQTSCSGTGVILVEPDSAERASDDHEALFAKPGVATLLVGPEGGWSATEVLEARRRAYHPWTLGRRTLRADAAALVGLAVLLGRWGEL